MDIDVNESKYRMWEIYSEETAGAPLIIRIDGNGFHELAARCDLKKPFDERFHRAMVNTTQEIMTNAGLNISFGHTASDELSLLFLKDSHLPHRGRIEKILSLLSAYATSSFQKHLSKFAQYDELISFDARIVKVKILDDVVEYFGWRSLESYRNFLNAYAQSLIGKKRCLGMKGEDIVKELRYKGFDVDGAPKWQRYGTVAHWMFVKKEGYNPITKEAVTVQRKKIATTSIDLTSSQGKKWLRSYIEILQ